MADIKTRDTVKGTIKTLDKATVAGQKMKEAYIATKEKAERSVNANENTAEEYAAALESRLEGILGRIDGVGEVEVMITLKSGYTYTYAVTEKVNSDVSEEYKSDDQRKSQQKNTTEQSYVMVEDGGSPLVTALNEPEIKGVVVVCAGGGAPKVVAQVTAAVKTALDISSAKITVSKISSGAAGH